MAEREAGDENLLSGHFWMVSNGGGDVIFTENVIFGGVGGGGLGDVDLRFFSLTVLLLLVVV